MKKNPFSLWFFILFFFGIACTSNSGNKLSLTKGSKISGKVISIIDGDTYDILIKGNRTIRIRMEGIDAPERGMPFYRVSKNYLAKLCFQKEIKVNITSKDAYDRYIGYSYLKDGTELGYEMIKSGYAWHFKKYNSDLNLADLEIEARKLKLGLWVDQRPMQPWVNRSLHYDGISTKDSFKIKLGQE